MGLIVCVNSTASAASRNWEIFGTRLALLQLGVAKRAMRPRTHNEVEPRRGDFRALLTEDPPLGRPLTNKAARLIVAGPRSGRPWTPVLVHIKEDSQGGMRSSQTSYRRLLADDRRGDERILRLNESQEVFMNQSIHNGSSLCS